MIAQQETTSSPPPSLAPLYFNTKNQELRNDALATLPSEAMSNITSFLDWGDYARLSAVNSTYKNIVDDAAQHENNESKWALSLALLNGTNGLAANPSLAMSYLHELTGTTADKSKFNPKFEHYEDEEQDEHCMLHVLNNNHAITAMRKLATCYLEGSGVDADKDQGLAWLKVAHHHGDVDAAYHTALIYEHGKHGVPVDIYHAAEWFLGAAKVGHIEAMAEYAMCCELGCGVEQSDEGALDWYTKAAQRGHATANFSVGEMFEEARGGLPQSDTEAVLWYFKAAQMGDEDSRKALVRLNDIARIVLPNWAATLNG
jgi:hypothetical protein